MTESSQLANKVLINGILSDLMRKKSKKKLPRERRVKLELWSNIFTVKSKRLLFTPTNSRKLSNSQNYIILYFICSFFELFSDDMRLGLELDN